MIHWLDTSEQLTLWLASQPPASAMALDTEFIRERTFHAQLSLVQLTVSGDDITLFDAIPAGAADALCNLLTDSSIEKIAHSASEDLQALRHRFGATVAGLFDTQIAAALVGLGAGLSYQRLAATLLGRELDKGETRSDWLRRPLTAAQCRYAADDVRDLPEIHRILVERLERLDRRGWQREDCQRLVEASVTASVDPNPHLAMRAAQRLAPEAQWRLRRLLVWRDEHARRLDRPRGWILDNELALLLATRPPSTRARFEALLNGYPRAPRRDRDLLWEQIEQPITETERELPLAAPADPAWRQKLLPLQQAVASLAQSLNIPESLLCPRRHLEALLANPGKEWPEALLGWRQPLLETALSPLLQESA